MKYDHLSCSREAVGLAFLRSYSSTSMYPCIILTSVTETHSERFLHTVAQPNSQCLSFEIQKNGNALGKKFIFLACFLSLSLKPRPDYPEKFEYATVTGCRKASVHARVFGLIAFVFKMPRFKNVFRSHENPKPVFSNFSWLRNVSEKLRFRDR